MLLSRVLEPEVMDSAEEAEDYDAMDHGEVNRLFVDSLVEAAAEEITSIPSGMPDGGPDEDATCFLDFLDLGAGTAQIPIELCQRDERFRCVAVDMAPSMLEIARVNLEMAHLAEQVMLGLEDAKSLPYEDERFAVTFSNSLVHHLPDPAPAIAEAVRVTKTGGTLFFRDLIRPPDDAAVKRLVYTYARLENERQQQLLDQSLRAALSLEEIREIVAGCGFPATSVRTTSDRHWTWVGQKQ